MRQGLAPRPAPAFGARTLGAYLRGQPITEAAPPPDLHLGRPAALILVRPAPGGVAVLRLWPSQLTLPGGPVYVAGAVVLTEQPLLAGAWLPEETPAPEALAASVRQAAAGMPRAREVPARVVLVPPEG